MNIDEIFKEVTKPINKLDYELRSIILSKICIEYLGFDRRNDEEKERDERYIKENNL